MNRVHRAQRANDEPGRQRTCSGMTGEKVACGAALPSSRTEGIPVHSSGIEATKNAGLVLCKFNNTM